MCLPSSTHAKQFQTCWFIANYRCCFQWDSFLYLSVIGHWTKRWQHLVSPNGHMSRTTFDVNVVSWILWTGKLLSHAWSCWKALQTLENTLPKTNISPEKSWLEDYFPFKHDPFLKGTFVKFQGCTWISKIFTIWISKRFRQLGCGEDVIWKHGWIMGQTSSTGFIITQSFKKNSLPTLFQHIYLGVEPPIWKIWIKLET